MADLSRFIPTPAQMEALGASFQRVGRVAQEAADNMVEAFAAAARRLEWERAEARREAQWQLQQEKNILRQQLDRDTSHFGRKRRWRRARGRRIEARRTTPAQIFHSTPEGSVILTVERWAGAQRLMRSHCADAARYLNPSLGQPWEEQADV